MKIVLTVFAPLLVAIGIRLALLLLSFVVGFLGFFIEDLEAYREMIGVFDTFDFEESWFYWILVIIGSFIAEYIIWSED